MVIGTGLQEVSHLSIKSRIGVCSGHCHDALGALTGEGDLRHKNGYRNKLMLLKLSIMSLFFF